MYAERKLFLLNKKTLLPVSNYSPGKKLPPHLSPYYEVNEKGEYVYEIENEEDMKDEEKEDKNKEVELTKEDKELREMMLSNNKKKLLQKIREEALKKKKTKVKVNKTVNKKEDNSDKDKIKEKNKKNKEKEKQKKKLLKVLNII